MTGQAGGGGRRRVEGERKKGEEEVEKMKNSQLKVAVRLVTIPSEDKWEKPAFKGKYLILK